MILLDTNILVAHFRGVKTVSGKISANIAEIKIPAIVLAELEYGAGISQRPVENLKNLRTFADTVEILSFDRTCAEAYGHIKVQLKAGGKMAGEIDVLIAAVARANEGILVTHNLKHFQAIEGIRLEDWLS